MVFFCVVDKNDLLYDNWHDPIIMFERESPACSGLLSSFAPRVEIGDGQREARNQAGLFFASS